MTKLFHNTYMTMKDIKMNTCSVCSCDFSLEDEGGIQGDFGIIPVSFCPTCLCCMEDMCDQLREGYEDEQIW